MSIWNFSTQRFFTYCLLLISGSLFGQTTQTVQFSGAKMRAPLSLPTGTSTVQICGLEAGNSYKVVAVAMGHDQRASFEIAPATAFSKGTSMIAFMRESANAVSFAAPGACVELQVKSSSAEQGNTVPMFLSIVCETCPEANAWLNKISGLADQSVLEVEDGFSAKQLIEDVLVGGGCFQISNVTYTGENVQIGTFSNGMGSLGIDQGIIMATGNIQVAPGPNHMNGASIGFGYLTPDPDLGALTTEKIHDMADIEFDFIPTQSQVSFEFIFASEEYCEFVNTKFNDVFGFFISGPGITGTQNIAVLPSSAIPVSINTVNHMVNASLYTHNTPASGNNCAMGGPGVPPPTPVPPASGPGVNELQFDGFTKKMFAIANVIPCQKYHIKLKIADVSDGVWDSAVFLRANSFDAGGEVLATPAYPGAQGVAYENCSSGSVRFARGGSNINQPLVVSFTVAGSAVPGVDYVPITSPVVIPAGQTEVLIPVNVLPDAIAEGPENIQLVIPNSCSCSQGTVDFVINDRPSLQLAADNQLLCAGENVLLQARVSGGLPSLSYHWNTGETTASISPNASGTYSVTVEDGCSVPASTSLELNFADCGCASKTFIKTLGETGASVRGYGVYDSQDGNLYITGLKQDSAMILKMTPQGDVLWMRAFDVQDGVNDHISELIVDSEGMLVGCGHSGDAQPGLSGFVFRYNPLTNNMQWLNTYGLESAFVMGLVELPNGNYLVYDNPHQPANDNRLLEITRPDGLIDFSSPLTQKLNLGGADNFNSALYNNQKIYGVGRYTNGNNFSDMRNALSRIDVPNGNVEWSRLSHVPPNQSARLYGMDLLLENNALISIAYGSETDDNLFNSQIFLQKTGLGGNLIWEKRFNIPAAVSEVADEVISVPDGFILYAHDSNAPNNDLFLLKTDKNGEFQWAKKVDYGFNDFVSALSTFQSQILLKDNHLFFITATEGAGGRQMLVAKTTLDGTVEGNCDYIQTLVVDHSDVSNPENFAVFLQKLAFSEQTAPQVRFPNNIVLEMEQQCKVSLSDSLEIRLCPDESVVIGNITYTQDTSFSLVLPGNGGCDTTRVYTISLQPYPTRTENVSLCPGGSVTIGGQVYTQAGVLLDTIAASTGCDTVVTYTISLLPYQLRSEIISLCPGQSVTIGGQVYTQAGVVVDTISASTGCDTIVTYTISLLPYQARSENVSLCPGGSITIGGQVYTQAGIVTDTLPGLSGCDTIVTYTIQVNPYQTRSVNLSFCPGTSVTIGGQQYTQSGVVLDTIAASTGCDTIVTYTLTQLPQPSRAETIRFCPGESIVLGGVTYTQPGVFVLTYSGSAGACDTIVTYTLQYSTPAPSTVNITCPAPISIDQPGGTGAVVTFNPATASSDCTCPGISLTQTAGLASGSVFPTGITQVCFTARDSCGQTASCCFNVSIQEEDACDVKVNGCVKYELLNITEDMGKNRTYRIRVTNNCANKLIYTAIQIPDGLVAMSPANFSTYDAPSGNTYLVRSPNYSPQYSIRFSSVSDSINNGESDIFKYKIPAQANVTFIHVTSRLAPYVFVSAHLNTFYCPIGMTPGNDRPEGAERELIQDAGALKGLYLFPNPTTGALYADFSAWKGEQVQVRVFDGRGRLLKQGPVTADTEAQALELPLEMQGGIYFLEIETEDGVRYVERFVVVR